MVIVYRACTNAEFDAVSELEMLVWKMSERQSISSDVLTMLSHTGGGVLGAFDGEKLVGFTIAFATNEVGRLWSHIAAVHPDYQSQGIGYELKHKQRAWAIGQGYQRMSWTFDPLQRRNAYFNFHLLGAECWRYHENFYGEMRDGINAGLPSDRFEVLWDFAEKPRLIPPDEAPFLLDATLLAGEASQEWHFAEIPYEINQLKAEDIEQAQEWQLMLRAVMQGAFAKAYKVVDFVADAERKRAYYCLHRS
jgi:predicted GNAT superfamily acetyltransferase